VWYNPLLVYPNLGDVVWIRLVENIYTPIPCDVRGTPFMMDNFFRNSLTGVDYTLNETLRYTVAP